MWLQGKGKRGESKRQSSFMAKGDRRGGGGG